MQTENLTEQEARVLVMKAAGMANDRIAKALHITIKTVSNILQLAREHMEYDSVRDMVADAKRANLGTCDPLDLTKKRMTRTCHPSPAGEGVRYVPKKILDLSRRGYRRLPIGSMEVFELRRELKPGEAIVRQSDYLYVVPACDAELVRGEGYMY